MQLKGTYTIKGTPASTLVMKGARFFFFGWVAQERVPVLVPVADVFNHDNNADTEVSITEVRAPPGR